MIIFDLDGTLADCEHRRHFVDKNYHLDRFRNSPNFLDNAWLSRKMIGWQPDWQAFYEACDQDKPIEPVMNMFMKCVVTHEVQIWSGRCESVRDKTINWLDANLSVNIDEFTLKMRPIGDNTPDDELKERWLDEASICVNELSGRISQSNPIDFVFDSNLKSIAMWRRRGIFVFNCAQHDGKF